MTYIIPFIRRFPSAEIESIQSGETNVPLNFTTQTQSITAVTKNKSFLVFQLECDDSSNDPQRLQFMGRINSSTQIEFLRKSSGGQANIRWWVVEFKASSAANVQHGSHARVGNLDNITISAVNLANSFPIVTWRSFGTNPDNDNMAAAEITSTTNLQLRFNSSAGMDLEWQVIENPNWTVTKYTDTMVTADTIENTPITAITLADNWLVSYYEPKGSGNMDGGQRIWGWIQSTTNIRVQRSFTGNFNIDIVHYLINGNAKFACQHFTDTIANGNTSGTTALSPNVDTAKSIIHQNAAFLSQGNNPGGVSADGEDVCTKHQFNSASQVGSERWAAASYTTNFAFCTVDFTNGF